MKTSISFNPNEALTNTAKPNKPNSTQANQSSFSSFLSKELSSQKNKATENASDGRKNNVSNAPAKNGAPKSATGSADQVKEKDESEKDTKALEQDTSGTGQLLTFVENLGQFNLKPELASSEEVENPAIDGLNLSERALAESKDPTDKGSDSGLTDEASSFASTIMQNTNNELHADDSKANLDTTNKSKLDASATTPLINKPDNLLNNAVDAKAERQNAAPELNQDLAVTTQATPVQAQNFAQHLSANTPAPASSLATDHISPRVGTTAWNQAVSQKVVWMVGGGQQTAELTLNPPDLGPLQVVISVSNDQASANFFAAQPDVREALEAALPRLRQMMSEAGVELSGFSVNSQASNQGGQSSGSHQQARQQNNSTAVSLDTSITNRATGTASISTNEGLVDTFA
jgi:flagellar hook-length control protein FliK